MREWWKKHRPTARRLVQLYCALLYNANLKGFVNGKIYTGNTKAVCVPGLNCYSCPGAVGACPLGSLQNALASSGHTAGWYVYGILLLFGITLGRTVCGWLCPVGLVQELLHKIPTPKIRKSRVTRALSYLKYVVLAVFVFTLPLFYGLTRNIPLPAFCKYICPAGTGEGAIALLSNKNNTGMFAQLGSIFTEKIIVLAVIVLACIFCYRSFCRFLCPLGTIYGLFNRFALAGVKVDESRCNHCGLCVRKCEMDVRRVNDRECISCGKCIGHCAQCAISLKCGSSSIIEKEKNGSGQPGQEAKTRKTPGKAARYAAGAFLAALLVFALIWFNIIERKPEAPDWSSDAPVGSEVGQQLEDFSCTLMNGETFRLSDHRGSIVIINQWATYCTPCVGELPYFEQLQEEYPEVVILAVHHWLEASPKAADYIRDREWTDWKIRFALDTKEESIIEKIGGDNTMPRTAVLNRQGEVIYNEQRSVTYEMLKSILEEAQ